MTDIFSTDSKTEVVRDENLFSYWFPKVKNCGIQVPKSIIIPTTQEVREACCYDDPEKNLETIRKWVTKNVLPEIDENKFGTLLFVKNGTFSNKFNASDSFCFRYNLAESIANINYFSLCFGAGGTSEIVIRERIRHDEKTVACIYDGLPLRTEFRVFYDFDTKKVLYTANYWDRDYVSKNLHSLTDKIIFEAMSKSIETEFNNKKDEVEKIVDKHMKSVDGLSGAWSVDIMLANEEYYLIDMAKAENSAYWNG